MLDPEKASQSFQTSRIVIGGYVEGMQKANSCYLIS